tara:strand:- start:268 stop:576 length:309 start_codon:yes stop_codon:yes gene_type:complete
MLIVSYKYINDNKHMNTPDSFTSKEKNIIFKNWDNLDGKQKETLIKIWKVLTYKWQLQILFNLPFLLWWVLDITFVKVHEFDLKLISYLNLPDWATSMMGFN